MNKRNWILLTIVIFIVIIMPGGFLLAGYLTKKKLDESKTVASPKQLPTTADIVDSNVIQGDESEQIYFVDPSVNLA